MSDIVDEFENAVRNLAVFNIRGVGRGQAIAERCSKARAALVDEMERLRQSRDGYVKDSQERQVESDRWKARCAMLEKALEPFAEKAEIIARDHPGWDHDVFQWGAEPLVFKMKALRDARAALRPTTAEETKGETARERKVNE
jgi:hypothetical protein